ncbi:B12-binding domain-containing radical SAM protein [Reichenbachiella versicolor]|uniref:B12-binding domain-containing radical SAM protein n=1 Tax=Reichenbachiella versicolor TaxID=1821036 RepID=UPI000D6E97B9|nr:radical SAM protein [Reichenbachiella versicolor]
MVKDLSVLLLTPPFTQLGTPYPGTVYLKGFLNTLGVKSFQADVGLEVILQIFSSRGLTELFQLVDEREYELDDNEYRIFMLRDEYIHTIDSVISFLQNKNPTLAYAIAEREYLPEASRFDLTEDLDWAFGSLGVQDKARHLATLYLEDIGDLIRNTVDPEFGFTRYAERIGRTASSFDEMNEMLSMEPTFVDEYSISIVQNLIEKHDPDIVCLSIPFPGNLYGGFRIAKFIKQKYPEVRVSMGGGFPNTELRSLSDVSVFDYIDFVSLDDGERPIQNILEYISGDRELEDLKRTFARLDDKIVYFNKGKEGDIPFAKTGTPDYTDLSLNEYISVIELANPMHRLWSDGRWNKLTMAHGCYWKKCSFCDISLDYIEKYDPISAKLIVDRMQEQIETTGETGFHFVDEAAPPALMKEVALEILRRKLSVSWWTNIRFEKRFTEDLCRLLKASGCIAVSGGLEVASDRLLAKMDKGVTVEQVARVARNFTESGIMVHAYLMYGFPTQTDQETIDSLEMVRQMMEQGVIQSGFWHQFAMTAHSPVGLDPESFGVVREGPEFAGFAENDLFHLDPDGADHESYSDGLKQSLFNYMHGMCFDYSLQEWFDFEVPKPSVSPVFIEMALQQSDAHFSDRLLIIWLGSLPEIYFYEKRKKGKTIERAKWVFQTKSKSVEVTFELEVSNWFASVFEFFKITSDEKQTFKTLKNSYESLFSNSFESFIKSEAIRVLRREGLLFV